MKTPISLESWVSAFCSYFENPTFGNIMMPNSKMTNEIHVLMWDTNDIYTVRCHCIKNQMHSFRKTVITTLDILTILARIWVLSEPLKS